MITGDCFCSGDYVAKAGESIFIVEAKISAPKIFLNAPVVQIDSAHLTANAGGNSITISSGCLSLLRSTLTSPSISLSADTTQNQNGITILNSNFALASSGSVIINGKSSKKKWGDFE